MSFVARYVCSAMGSLCEVFLFGDDTEQLDSVAKGAFDEIARVEQLLSRFDPTSELSRINREAARGECLVDFELLQILSDCCAWWHRTGGAFDITVGSRDEIGRPVNFDAVEWDAAERLVSFRSPGLRLDLGAYGKGYALDRAAALIRAQGVTAALLNLGTSSLVAIGSPPDVAAWPIDMQSRFASSSERHQIPLSNAALSSSATWHLSESDEAPSDLLDPATGEPVPTQIACTVVAPKGSTAEALSTAFVVMGRHRAESLLRKWSDSTLRVYWATEDAPSPRSDVSS